MNILNIKKFNDSLKQKTFKEIINDKLLPLNVKIPFVFCNFDNELKYFSINNNEKEYDVILYFHNNLIAGSIDNVNLILNEGILTLDSYNKNKPENLNQLISGSNVIEILNMLGYVLKIKQIILYDMAKIECGVQLSKVRLLAGLSAFYEKFGYTLIKDNLNINNLEIIKQLKLIDFIPYINDENLTVHDVAKSYQSRKGINCDNLKNILEQIFKTKNPNLIDKIDEFLNYDELYIKYPNINDLNIILIKYCL